MKLTKQDIKIIKYAKRPGYVIGFVLTILCCIVNLFNIKENINIFELVFSFLLSPFNYLIFLAFYQINRKYNLDLKSGIKNIKVKKIEKKIYPYNYPEQDINSSYYLVIDGIKKYVEKELFESVQEDEEIEMHYTTKSEMLLDIAKIDNKRNPFIL